MAAMGRCLVVCVLFSLVGPGAALVRSRQPDEMVSSGASGVHGEASDQLGDSHAGQTGAALKDTYNRPPQNLRESGDAAAKIAGIPTEAPVDSPSEVPGVFSRMIWKTLTMNVLSVLITFLFSLALLFVIAWLYARFKEDPAPTTDKERLAWRHGGQTAQSIMGDWRYGFCECYAKPSVCCMSCFCPAIRWADTMRMAGQWHFWMGFVIFASLSLLNTPTAGLTGLILLCVLVYQRQRLRELFEFQTGAATYCVDCLLYCCCGCCTIAQDAQQMEEAYAVGHLVLHKFQAYKLRPGQLDYTAPRPSGYSM